MTDLLCIHLVNEYLLKVYYVTGIVLLVEDLAVNNNNKKSPLHQGYRKADCIQINEFKSLIFIYSIYVRKINISCPVQALDATIGL